jgi:hypothetical protein
MAIAAARQPFEDGSVYCRVATRRSAFVENPQKSMEFALPSLKAAHTF